MDGEFYLPFDFVSGATADIENINESHRFAWVLYGTYRFTKNNGYRF